MMKASSTLPFCLLLSACAAQPIAPSHSHISTMTEPAGSSADIPAPVRQSGLLLPPKPAPKTETYSVTVYKIPVQSLLFALARDAKLNVDIHPDIKGDVTLNAIEQTLPQILDRISKQVDMRYELNGPNLSVLPDLPFLRNYRIDYVNMSRSVKSEVNIATQISTAGGTDAASGGGAGGNNNSLTSVSNLSKNMFWETLVQNIRDTLLETGRVRPDAPAASNDGAATVTPAKGTAAPAKTAQAASVGASADSRDSTSVIANPETGLIAVRATARQHEKIQQFLDLVMSSAKRQVLIEATVVEVQLSDQYQQGINWQSLRKFTRDANGVPVYDRGFNAGQTQAGSALTAFSTSPLPSAISAPNSASGLLALNYSNPTSFLGNIAATIQLLESFGKVKVLSSPKISVLNNQTALLKVVDNQVYFTIIASTTAAQTGIAPTTTYTSELHTVPVGFVMSVTPQIADTDEVTMNVRPSISRIIAYVQDPNPALAAAVVPVVSSVPVIQTREMESMLKVSSGQIAVMGGLMQDTVNNRKDSIPGVNKVPLFGDALSSRNESTGKSELVIFLRPLVVKDASLSGDYKQYRYLLPDGQPLNEPRYGEKAEPLSLQDRKADTR
jgi:MSHA biogenesis protein MshL